MLVRAARVCRAVVDRASAKHCAAVALSSSRSGLCSAKEKRERYSIISWQSRCVALRTANSSGVAPPVRLENMLR
jgi:hypothetical protein